MVAIIDYGVGNLFSLVSSFAAIGEKAAATRDASVIKNADRIILPGVGAFKDAADKLNATGMADIVRQQCSAGKPLMGICLGMQLLFDRSFELLPVINTEQLYKRSVLHASFQPSIFWISSRNK